MRFQHTPRRRRACPGWALLLCLIGGPAGAEPGRADARLSPPVERALVDPEPGALGKLSVAALSPHDQAMVAFTRGLRAFRAGRWGTAAQALCQAADAEALANADMARFFAAESLFHQGLYASAGRSNGRVIAKRVCSGPAPAIRPASSSCGSVNASEPVEYR